MGIAQRDVVSITGCGGKTAIMLKLSQELRAHKTLITTTTKILMPSKNQYDYFYLSQPVVRGEKGITLAAKGRAVDGKLYGYEPKVLDELVKSFDYAIIESDGAKMKLLKAWNELEPVIIGSTTKTVGVMNFKLLGAGINSENIHRMDIYVKNFCRPGDKVVDLAQMQRMICSPQGLFKNALGKKILFLNQIENERDREAVKRLWEQRLEAGANFPDKIVYGSLLKEEYGTYAE